MGRSIHQDHLSNRTAKGMLISSISIITNIILAIFKYWIGLQLASVAILVEAWHTLSDSLTSIVVFISFKMSAKPPDHEHPFGHGRTEAIASLFIGFILSLVVFNFFIESLRRLFLHHSINYNQAALIIFIISIVFKEFLAQISIRTGKTIKSNSLIADGWHHRSDAFASLMVIMGILLNPYVWWIDAVMGIFISLIIAKFAFDILKNTISSLIGEKPGDLFLQQLHQIVEKSTSYNVQLHHVNLHKYGNHSELTFHIILPGEMKLEQAHQIATQLETTINREMSVETTIHVESHE